MKGLGFYNQEFISVKRDRDLIRENILRVLLTSPGERINSNFGCKLKDYLFEQSNVLIQEIEDEIRKSITQWEPRVVVRSIQVSEAEKNSVKLNIDFLIKETYEDFNLNTVIRF